MTGQGRDYAQRWADTLEAVDRWHGALGTAAAAELRRCRTPEEVELHPAFHRLRRSLPEDAPVSSYTLPMLVGLSAHLREPGGDATDASLAQVLGSLVGDKRLLSEARFRRLMAEEDVADLHVAMVRVLRQVGERVNLAALWRGLAYWNTRTRRRWAYAYYENEGEN